MSAHDNDADGRGESTRAIHGPAITVPTEDPFGLPVYRSAVFGFESAKKYADVLGGRSAGYVYSRIDNPTSDAFASAFAALEGHGLGTAVEAQPFASGMAAISTVLFALCSAGERVLVVGAVYGGTYGLLTKLFNRFGVEVDFVNSVGEAKGAVRRATRVIWTETIANPTLSVADLPVLSELASEAHASLIVDSTFATPFVCQPLLHGVDLVVHSATKYIGGHSDVTGGVVVGSPDLVAEVRACRIDLGGSLSPDDAFLLHRGLETLPLRVERHCKSAAYVALELEGHPRLEHVFYPGLRSHPDHDRAARLFIGGRFGGIVTLVPNGGREGGQALCDRLRLIRNATSLGGTHSVVSHVASTTHRQLDDEALLEAGIPPSAVRVSVGLEDAEDVLSDLLAALDG